MCNNFHKKPKTIIQPHQQQDMITCSGQGFAFVFNHTHFMMYSRGNIKTVPVKMLPEKDYFHFKLISKSDTELELKALTNFLHKEVGKREIINIFDKLQPEKSPHPAQFRRIKRKRSNSCPNFQQLDKFVKYNYDKIENGQLIIDILRKNLQIYINAYINSNIEGYSLIELRAEYNYHIIYQVLRDVLDGKMMICRGIHTEPLKQTQTEAFFDLLVYLPFGIAEYYISCYCKFLMKQKSYTRRSYSHCYQQYKTKRQKIALSNIKFYDIPPYTLKCIYTDLGIETRHMDPAPKKITHTLKPEYAINPNPIVYKKTTTTRNALQHLAQKTKLNIYGICAPQNNDYYFDNNHKKINGYDMRADIPLCEKRVVLYAKRIGLEQVKTPADIIVLYIDNSTEMPDQLLNFAIMTKTSQSYPAMLIVILNTNAHSSITHPKNVDLFIELNSNIRTKHISEYIVPPLNQAWETLNSDKSLK